MPFKKLMYFMLSMVKQSTQNALERFFPQLEEAMQMSQQAFSEARQKIKWEAFEELFQASVEGSYEEEGLLEWKGFRLFAIDSSQILLPRDANLREYFGAAGKEYEAAAARVSVLYDIENDIIADATLEPLTADDRSMAKKNLESFERLEAGKAKKLVLFDRGYPSKDFIKYLQDKEIKYLMRVQRKFNTEVDALDEGGGDIRLGNGVRFRAYVFTLEGGEREALITNLTKREASDAELGELYRKRWSVETKYQGLKQKLELENFSGRLVDTIKQDFYGLMTVSNMLSSVLREANRKIQKKNDGKDRRKERLKYEYRANVNHAVGVFKDRLVGVLIAEDNFVRKKLYQELVVQIKSRVVPIRPGREVARKEFFRKPHFHHNHKSNC